MAPTFKIMVILWYHESSWQHWGFFKCFKAVFMWTKKKKDSASINLWVFLYVAFALKGSDTKTRHILLLICLYLYYYMNQQPVVWCIFKSFSQGYKLYLYFNTTKDNPKAPTEHNPSGLSYYSAVAAHRRNTAVGEQKQKSSHTPNQSYKGTKDTTCPSFLAAVQ